MSSTFLTKLLDGSEASFLRFEGADKFVVEVDGEERIVSRETWNKLPETKRTDQDIAYSREHRNHR